MSPKTDKQLEECFITNAKNYITYEKLVKFMSKPPTLATAKKIDSLSKKYKVKLYSSAEIAKMKNIAEAKKEQEEKEKLKVREETKETPKQEKAQETKHTQPKKKNRKKERSK